MSTTSHVILSSKSNQFVFFITLGKKNERIFLFEKSLCIHVMFVMRCIMYVLCTLPMYHLSTPDHNLYTFAQSTQCLYIRSCFMSRMIFFYTCACVRFCQKTMKKLTRIIKPIQRVSLWVSASVMILITLLQCERNKSPCRKQMSAFWRVKDENLWTVRASSITKCV